MRKLYDNLNWVYLNERRPIMPDMVANMQAFTALGDTPLTGLEVGRAERYRLSLSFSQEVTVPQGAEDTAQTYQMKQACRSMQHYLARDVIEKLRELELHLHRVSSYDPKTFELLRDLREELIP